jgi:ligand-binding SRPBCC domain-containing protein
MHDDPSALKALTPPPLQVKILEMDAPLKQGSELKFRLGIGPLGVVWHAVYDEFKPYQEGMMEASFVDRSLSSPFHAWTHRHIFRHLGDGTSTVTDDAQFELIGGALGRVITWIVAYPAIAFLFLYRRMQTYRILARMSTTQFTDFN